jgi:hypothetical protein
MGDRVLVQLKRKEQNGTGYSPVLYAHWSGRWRADPTTLAIRSRA